MNKTNSPQEKHFAYLRKSSEQKEKQALSIQAQKSEIIERFPNLNIEFIEEEKSAFKYRNRPHFENMLKRIQDGEATGLIAWHPDRLSRNEIDAAQITYLVRTGVIEKLNFVSYTFDNSPEGIMMLQFALSQSQYESAKKAPAIKRGMKTKAQLGWLPNKAPSGYENYNKQDSSTAIRPAKDFKMYRKMFDLMLTGKYTPPQIQKIVNEEWCFKTKNNKKLCRSMIYKIFTNSFYYGEFEYPKGSGIWHTGKHKAMITFEEHEKILELMGKKTSTRGQHREFAYKGPLRCGGCDAMITAQRNVKRQKNGNVHIYYYYHCTGRKDPNCEQKHLNIRGEKLEEQVSNIVESIEIPKEFHAYALKWLKKENGKESVNREVILKHQREEYDECVDLLDGLTDMRAKKEIDAEDFKRRQSKLIIQKKKLWKQLQETDERVDRWIKVANDMFSFLDNIKLKLADGDKKTKTAILESIGTSFILKDRKLTVELLPVLSMIQIGSKEIKAIHSRLKPQKTLVTQEDFEREYAISSSLLGVWDEVGTVLCNKT